MPKGINDRSRRDAFASRAGIQTDSAQSIRSQRDRRNGRRQVHEGRPGADSAGHDDHPRVRGDARLGEETGALQDIPYNHRGPAHLSIGQEAAAVGQAYLLDVDDHIFGSHRSHGEILAKRLSAIHKLDDKPLMAIMANYFGGDCLRVVEQGATGIDEGSGDRLYRLRGAGGDFRPRHRGESRLWRLDARLFPAVRRLSEQCHRRRIGRHLRRRGALQARQPAARHRDCQHRRRFGGLRPDLGSAVLRHDGSVQGTVGRKRIAADCR